MRVHRVVLMVLDFDDLGADSVRDVIVHNRYPNDCIHPSAVSVDTQDIGAWDDDHPLNKSTTWREEFLRLFHRQHADLVSALRSALHCAQSENHPFRHWHLQAAEALERAQPKEVSHE